jgi:DNA cross-link repair 1C protein
MLLDGHDVCAISLDGIGSTQGTLPLEKLAKALASFVTEKRSASLTSSLGSSAETLPRKITFPYSRHSSYAELCHLVKIFDPKDVYPCTVDETNWDEGMFPPVAFMERFCCFFPSLSLIKAYFR